MRTRLRGQRAPGIPRSLLRVAPLPPFRGGTYKHSSGASCRGDAETYVKIRATSLRGAQRRSNPLLLLMLRHGLRRFARNDELLFVVAPENGRSSIPRRQ